ncbi:MAG: hypothetical protein IKC69_05210, partial [Clostridia bacterium]|nr:hypothetical protein [Clostridia bacterium]
TYLCTPSGNQKARVTLLFAQFVRSASFFPIPLKGAVKKLEFFYSSFFLFELKNLSDLMRKFSFFIALGQDLFYSTDEEKIREDSEKRRLKKCFKQALQE